MKRGFTLIELLIVVAIIAILAAIAVPNFLEAQTRSKVARIKSDLRTYATAVEAYTVDNNRVPRELNDGWYPGDTLTKHDGTPATGFSGIFSNLISSPIAYITVARIIDPFQDKNLNAALDEQFYSYNDYLTHSTDPLPNGGGAPSAFYKTAPVFYGNWRMLSVGPDRKFGHSGTAPTAQLAYDATNGSVSAGNIFRSSKSPESIQPDPGRTYVNGADSAILLGAP